MVKKEGESDASVLSEGKSKPAESTKGTILRVALEEFALKSVDGARTREIARKAGVNHAAINYYFGGKNEMYVEILKGSVEHFKQEYADIMLETEHFLKESVRTKAEAINLIKKFLLKLHSVFTSPDFQKFMLLLKREEVFPSENFDIPFEGSFKVLLKILIALIKVAKPEISHAKAMMLSIALVGLNDSLSSCKTAYIRLTGKSTIPDDDLVLYWEVISESVEKILS